MIENIKELKDGLTIEELQDKWPWILKGNFIEATIGKGGFRNDPETLIWYGGNWLSGVWEGQNNKMYCRAEWLSGGFMGGIWKDGVFRQGWFKDAVFAGGIMYNGWFTNSEWRGGHAVKLYWESGKVLLDGQLVKTSIGPNILKFSKDNVKFANGLTLEILECKKNLYWIFKAEISKATIGINEKNQLVWYDGTWESGYWAGGIWKNGTFKNGRWCFGTWEKGTWLNEYQTLADAKSKTKDATREGLIKSLGFEQYI